MGDFNVTTRRAKAFGYSDSELELDLSQKVNLHALRIRITALVTIAGGAVSGDVVEDGPARLLDSTRCEHDTFPFVQPIGGRDLLYLKRRLHPQTVSVVGLANADAQVNTPIRCDLEIPFSWDYLANPMDVFWAAQRVEQALKAYFQWATGTTTSASSPGSAALVNGGDRTVTISSARMVVTEVYTIAGIMPRFLPVLTATQTRQFDAANSELDFKLTSARRIAAHLFQMRYGSLGNTQDGINAAVLKAGELRKVDAEYDDLKAMEIDDFPGVPSTELGTVMFPYVHNGRLGTSLEPKTIGNDPQWLFDVDAPSSANGIIRVIGLELMERAGVTSGLLEA